MLLEDNEQIYAFTRVLGEETLLVICNFSSEEPVFELPEGILFAEKEVVISNYEVDPAEDVSSFHLKPYEARVYKLK